MGIPHDISVGETHPADIRVIMRNIPGEFGRLKILSIQWASGRYFLRISYYSDHLYRDVTLLAEWLPFLIWITEKLSILCGLFNIRLEIVFHWFFPSTFFTYSYLLMIWFEIRNSHFFKINLIFFQLRNMSTMTNFESWIWPVKIYSGRLGIKKNYMQILVFCDFFIFVILSVSRKMAQFFVSELHFHYILYIFFSPLTW